MKFKRFNKYELENINMGYVGLVFGIILGLAIFFLLTYIANAGTPATSSLDLFIQAILKSPNLLFLLGVFMLVGGGLGFFFIHT
jgi:ABC-type phosphate/phosphonate transport system permease subunit